MALCGIHLIMKVLIAAVILQFPLSLLLAGRCGLLVLLLRGRGGGGQEEKEEEQTQNPPPINLPDEKQVQGHGPPEAQHTGDPSKAPSQGPAALPM